MISTFIKPSLLLLMTLTLSITSIVASAEQPAQLVSIEQVKMEEVKPSIWLPANVISRMNAQISAEQTGQLL